MACSDGLDRRGLVLSDIPDAFALSAEAGWNQTAADWRLMIEHGDGFGIAAEDGRLVATALTHGFGPVGWISMVLVTRDYRRRGLATELLHRCVGSLQDRNVIPGLDATETGRKVYEPLGFRAIYALSRRSAVVPSIKSAMPGNIRRIDPSDFDAVRAYDTRVFGADRTHVLRHLLERSPGLGFVAEAGGRLGGYVIGRDGREATQIGPLVAQNSATAIGLLDAALGSASGRIYIDSLENHAEFNAHLATRGFTIQRGFTRMLLGRVVPFDDPARSFAIAGPELA
jgi:GNAT superfamily N-acetyltransferase